MGSYAAGPIAYRNTSETNKAKARLVRAIYEGYRWGDVAAFARVSQVYEDKEGVKPRLVMVSPFIDTRAGALGEQIGMELYTSPEEVVE